MNNILAGGSATGQQSSRLSRLLSDQRRGADDSLCTDCCVEEGGRSGAEAGEDDFNNSSRTMVTSGGAVIPILTRSPSTARTETLITPSRIILSPTFRRKTNMSGLFLWKRLRLKHPCAATLTQNRRIMAAVQCRLPVNGTPRLGQMNLQNAKGRHNPTHYTTTTERSTQDRIQCTTICTIPASQGRNN